MAPSLSYLCGVATAVYVTVFLTVVAVRWFHLCKPFDRKPHYYYPGRPFVVGIGLNALLLLPYVFLPESGDAWNLARLYFLPVTLMHFTILLFSYFGNVMQWRKWRWPMAIIGTPVALALIIAFGMAVAPGEQLGSVVNAQIAKVVLYLLGVILSAVCFVSMGVVFVWAGRFDPDDFSNPADFPVRFARRWIVVVLVNLLLCWGVTLTGSPAAVAGLQLFLSAALVFFLIAVLHPHRSRPVEEEDAPAPSAAESSVHNRTLSGKRRAEILDAIRTVVEEQELFLDPHLTLQDVADRCGYNRTYVSGLVKEEFGGFFTYVNRLRLQHVETWLQEHPAGTIQEAAEESGFGSRQSYYAIKNRLGGEE